MNSITPQLAEKLVEAYKDNEEEQYAIVLYRSMIDVLDGKQNTKNEWTIVDFWTIIEHASYLFHFKAIK